MLTHFLSSRGRRLQVQSGFTLMEMMVVLLVGMAILAAVAVTTITLSRSMVAISNYFQLDTSSRNTLDVMSRDIRNAGVLASYATNSITLGGTDYTGTAYSCIYNWDGSNMWRTYTANSNTVTWLMLSNCAYLAFSNYTRVPQTGFGFNAVTGTNRTKLISVSWKCSRSILGAKLNTESVQTAKIVIRN